MRNDVCVRTVIEVSTRCFSRALQGHLTQTEEVRKHFGKDIMPDLGTEEQVETYQVKGRETRQRGQHVHSTGSERKPSKM